MNYIIKQIEQTSMPNPKQQVIELIKNLPDNVTIEEILERLYFIIQVDDGLKELDEGKGIPHDEVETRFSL